MSIQKILYDLGTGITSFSSLRGICSETDPYSGFNVCHYVGDSTAHVTLCRDQLASELGIPKANIIIPRQTHSSDVAIIRQLPVAPEMTESVDAIVTDLKGVALCINTADCVPVLLSDSKAGVIAAVHSGWRGTVGRIVAKAVDAMISLGSSTEWIKAAMGPSICRECFEVGTEVADRFHSVFSDCDNIVDHTFSKPHINLATAIRHTLLESGLSDKNITDPPACSKCNPQDYFSARKLGVHSGRTLSLILQTDLLD